MDVLSLVITYAFVYWGAMYNSTEIPTANWTALNTTTWWGPAAEEATQDIGVYSASITFDDDMVTDLKARLARNVSYVAPLEGAAFTYGFNRDQLANWTTYWGQVYDFEARETALNAFPMYKTNIQGIDIFFIRVTPEVTEGTEVVPLLMLHGFPGSIREFYDSIPLISTVSSDRDFAVELIVPCLPGFGFSGKAVRKGMGAAEIAIIMRSLMLRLGFEQFYIQGGDFGGIITSHMATLFPDEVLGYHTNWAQLQSRVAILLQMVGSLAPSFIVDNDLYSRMYPLYTIFSRIMGGTGYLHWQATKPDTAGIPMSDSPAGLLAYHLENIARVHDDTNIEKSDGGLYDMFTQETLIDNMMFYWAPNSIASAFRLYSESFNKAQYSMRLEEIQTPVPTWAVQDKHEISYQSPTILKLKYTNLLNTTVLDYGGHFLAMEYPELFSESVLTAISAFRTWQANYDADC